MEVKGVTGCKRFVFGCVPGSALWEVQMSVPAGHWSVCGVTGGFVFCGAFIEKCTRDTSAGGSWIGESHSERFYWAEEEVCGLGVLTQMPFCLFVSYWMTRKAKLSNFSITIKSGYGRGKRGENLCGKYEGSCLSAEIEPVFSWNLAELRED